MGLLRGANFPVPHVQQCFTVHLYTELIITGWAFHAWAQYIVSSQPTRFFLTQQLIYKNTKLKNKILVQIFLYQTPVQPETFNYLEKEHFSDIRTHTPFFALWVRFWYLCCLKTRNICGSGPYHHRGILSSALINDWENNIAYGREESKQSQALAAGKCDWRHVSCCMYS